MLLKSVDQDMRVTLSRYERHYAYDCLGFGDIRVRGYGCFIKTGDSCYCVMREVL